jgi:hypothetical protein
MNLKYVKVITLSLVLGLTAFLGACSQTETPTDQGAPTEGAAPEAAPPAEGQ